MKQESMTTSIPQEQDGVEESGCGARVGGSKSRKK